MRILVVATVTPFLHGGADYHINGLCQALQARGHDTELLRLPFVFHPGKSIQRSMQYCEELDLSSPNGIKIDRLISLQFPCYGINHPDHWTWIMHQHRAVYELYDQQEKTDAVRTLHDDIHAYDRRVLSRSQKRFANSRRVAARLSRYNQLDSEALYHPPAFTERFFCAETAPYIFYPSRLETLKRQELLIEAARYLRSPMKILLAGDGSQKQNYQTLLDKYQLHERVRMLGYISEAEKLTYYAHAAAVFFGPYDEDYGYITLEAMLSSRPVLTCSDSGGPLEFVQHNNTGWICEPEPELIAEQIDWIYEHRARVEKMGLAGRAHYEKLDISWHTVVEKLTGK